MTDSSAWCSEKCVICGGKTLGKSWISGKDGIEDKGCHPHFCPEKSSKEGDLTGMRLWP